MVHHTHRSVYKSLQHSHGNPLHMVHGIDHYALDMVHGGHQIGDQVLPNHDNLVPYRMLQTKNIVRIKTDYLQ